MTGGDLVELEADELGRFCAFLGAKQKVLEYLDWFVALVHLETY